MAVVQISRIQIRRGQKNAGTGIPQLASGEMAWAIDTQELYIGNGAISEGSPAVGNTKILTDADNLLDLIGQFRAAMDSEDEDFYKDVQNFQRYSDLKRLESKMGSSISADNRKREVRPIIEPRSDAEFDSWNRMNPKIVNFSREEQRFHNICQSFEKDLSRQVPLIYDLNRIQTATSGMIIALDPKLIELGLKQGTLTYRGRMEGGEYFFLVDTDKGQRVYPIPTGVQFKPNAQGYFDLPFEVVKREDGTLKFVYNR